MKNIVCLFFAESKNITGLSSKEYHLEDTVNTQDFLDILARDFPRLIPSLQNSILAVNQEYVYRESPILLKDGDEVAVISPLSGG